MTINVGAAGGGLIMPEAYGVVGADVNLTNSGGVQPASGAGFWTEIDVSHTAVGYETVKLAAAANTTEQTILDITDVGVLTHVVAPSLSGAGKMTIRVTADGEVTTYTSETLATAQRYIVGAFLGYRATGTAANGIGFGSTEDLGIDAAFSRQQMLSPTQVVTGGFGIGIKFETSLKVTIQGSVNITGTANHLNACANYTLAIPKGV